VRIILEVDPFQKRPNAGVSIVDTAGNEVAQASIIETISRKMEINLHLRQAEPAGEYTALVKLYYEPTPDKDEPMNPENQAELLVVDQREAKFVVVRAEAALEIARAVAVLLAISGVIVVVAVVFNRSEPAGSRSSRRLST
jgi:hypothetical protein